MDKTQVLNELDENTHTLFKPEFLDIANKAFCTDIKPRAYAADGGGANPKGLTLDNGRSHAIGISAFDLAYALCDKLGVKYEEKLGRGSQVRACTSALRASGYGK